MKFKTQKNYKKIINFYKLNYGYNEPFTILLDPEFIQRANEISVLYKEVIFKTLGGKCNFYVTTCAIAECKRRGEDYKQILSMAKRLDYYKCDHVHDKDEVYLSRKCYADLSVHKPGTFYFAIQDNDFRFDLRRQPGVPILFLLTNKIILEQPSTASFKRTDQTHKLLTKTDEIDRELLLKAKFGDKYKPKVEREKESDTTTTTGAATGTSVETPSKEEKKRKREDGDDNNGESEDSESEDSESEDEDDTNKSTDETAGTTTDVQKPKKKKKKDHGPNPLSVMKKQTIQPPRAKRPGQKKNRRKLRPASAIKHREAKEIERKAKEAAKEAKKAKFAASKQQSLQVPNNITPMIEAQ